MTRFFRKSVALGLLSIVIGGVLSFNIAFAADSTTAAPVRYTHDGRNYVYAGNQQWTDDPPQSNSNGVTKYSDFLMSDQFGMPDKTAEEKVWDAAHPISANESTLIGNVATALKDTLAGMSILPFAAVLKLIEIILSSLLLFAGYLFDLAMKLSIFNLGTLVSSNETAINNAWALIRDIINIFYIFVLLYTGIKVIIGTFGAGEKTKIVDIILSAILINFSLFFVKIMIDASNIVAVTLYNQITNGGTVGISSILLNNTKLADLLGPSALTLAGATNILIVLILRIILIAAELYALLFGAFVFIGRTVMLIFSAVLSPLAFTFNAMGKEVNKYGSEWWKDFTNQLMVAPVFMFFMFIIAKFLANQPFNDIIQQSSTGQPDIMKYFGVYLYSILTIGLILKGMSMVKEYSGKVGEMGGKLASFASGAALTAVTGGTAVALQQTLGRGAAAIASNDALKGAASQSGIKGIGARLALRATTGASKASFDVRNTEAAKGTLGAIKGAGVDLMGGFAKGRTGGFVESKEAYAKAQTEFAKKQLGREDLTDEQALKEQSAKVKNYRDDVQKAEKEKFQASVDLGKETDMEKRKVLQNKISGYQQEVTEKMAALNKFDKANKRDKYGNLDNSEEALNARKDITNERKKAFQEGFAKVEEKAFLKGEATVFEAAMGALKIKTNKATGFGKAAAAQIRKDLITGKTKAQKLADAAKEVAEENEEKKGGAGTPPPAPPPVGVSSVK
ncbi:MAG: hypothetical protein WCX27_01395 [Candidatus Paceibacterota bacterium]|jgi:hypothetical protein